MTSLDRIKRLTHSPLITPKFAYGMGKDAGLNGANMTNCHFGIFSCPENTAEWERGKLDGEQAKKLASEAAQGHRRVVVGRP